MRKKGLPPHQQDLLPSGYSTQWQEFQHHQGRDDLSVFVSVLYHHHPNCHFLSCSEQMRFTSLQHPSCKSDNESTKQISDPCPCSEMDTESRSIHSFLTSDVTIKWHKSPLLFLEVEWWIQVSFCCSNEKMMMPEANEEC